MAEWTPHDHPPSWKNLDAVLRSKAIEIGNALLEDGMDKAQAIPIALSQARDALDRRGTAPDLWVAPDGDGWVVKPEGASPVERFATKKEAVDAGVERARQQGVALTVQKQDGTIEDRQSFRARVG